MILVLILFGIISILIGIFLLFILSTLHIEIKDFELSNIHEDKYSNYQIIFSLYLGNHIKWLWFHLNNEKARKIYSKVQLEKIDIKKFNKEFKVKNLRQLKKLKPKFSHLDLQVSVGLISPISTSFLVAIISSTISIILPHLVKKIEPEKYIYDIKPIYYNKNLYNIKLNCIIEIKMVHIINIISLYTKKGKSDKNEQSTSNRKSYAYSYE